MTETFLLAGIYIGLMGLGVSFTLLNSGLKVEFVRQKKSENTKTPH